jgi:hypothetical protein
MLTRIECVTRIHLILARIGVWSGFKLEELNEASTVLVHADEATVRNFMTFTEHHHRQCL